MNWEALRDGQREAVRTILVRYASGEPFTAIILPTRYGKTDVARISTHQLWLDGQLSAALFLSPNELLRDQAIDEDKWSECFIRYSLGGEGFKYRSLKNVEANFTVNGEIFVSSTLQLVNRNVDIFTKWVESMIYRTGKAPIVFVDECHTGSEDNSWGETSQLLAKAGAKVVLMTATAMRSDGRKIPGFSFDLISQESIKVNKYKPGSVPEKILVEIYQGTKSLLKLRAHHETTFREAWAEQPSPLCLVDRVSFDVDLSVIYKTGTEQMMLSDLSASDSRPALGRIVRSRVTVREGVSRLEREMRLLRRTVNDGAAIVFCGNDSDKDDPTVNQHAEVIRKEIERVAPNLLVVIATSADLGKDKIKRFQKGHGDVLIVKQMASIGLDLPRLKLALDLSPVRTPAAYIQRLMRIATPYRITRTCKYICPDDVIGRALFDGLISDSNGAAKAIDLELIRSYEKDQEPGDDDMPVWGINSVENSDFIDNIGNRGEGDQLDDVHAHLALFPELTNILTHAQIAQRLEGHTLVAKAALPANQIIDTGREMEDLRIEINDSAREITKHRCTAGQYDPQEYREIIQDVFVRAYRSAGISGQRLQDINNLVLLKRVRDALAQMEAEMAGVY